MEIKGKIHEIGETQQVTDSFKKRDIVIEYADNPQYPEFITVQFTQDRTNILDNYTVGNEVEVSFNLRGRPWTNKEGKTTYFNTLQGWKINKLNDTLPSVPAPVDLDAEGGDDDGLPF